MAALTTTRASCTVEMSDLLELARAVCFLKALSHQIKIATDWLQTCFRLASDSKIDVNGTILYQCNPVTFYLSEASLKRVGSQSEASRL